MVDQSLNEVTELPAIRIVRTGKALISRISTGWNSLSLTSQFVIMSSLVIVAGMTLVGSWVSDRIGRGVVQNAASNAALYLVGYVEHFVQNLPQTKELTAADVDRLDQLLRQSRMDRKIVGIKIWAPDGLLVFSTDGHRIGETFPVTQVLAKAWSGDVAHEYNELDDDENLVERSLGLPILEIYAPVRSFVTNEVVAVAEIYQVAEDLEYDRRAAFFHSAFVLGSLALVMIASLSHIVRRGNRTIEKQQRSLARRADELSRLLDANLTLQNRVFDANRRACENNERFLRQVGAELHDGPAQLVSLALLRLDALTPRLVPATDAGSGGDEIEVIRRALGDALTEVRAISAGIAIPELERANLEETIRIAVDNHQRRSGTKVALDFDPSLPAVVTVPIRICIYRFVQEGLNNAFRHANGAGQQVIARMAGEAMEICVCDRGNGAARVTNESTLSGGLGLRGLKDRIEALGGEFAVVSEPTGVGTKLFARFHPNLFENAHDH